VIGDVLRGFERAFVFELGRDAGSSESVVADPCLDAGDRRAALNHGVGVLLPHFVLSQLTSLASRRGE
jgi:hypothetical protein